MIRKTTILTAVIVTLLITATPVSAQSTSDLTTYTENDASGTVNVVSPSEIRFETHAADDYSAIYESELDTQGKDITISYTLNVTDRSGDCDWSSGLIDPETPSINQGFNSVWGARYDCSDNAIDIQSPWRGTTQTEVSTLTTNTEYEIIITYDYDTANMTVSVDDQSVTQSYPAALQYTVAPVITYPNGPSSDTISGRITNYDVSITSPSNTGEDFTTYTEINDVNTVNVTQNWVTFNDTDTLSGYTLRKKAGLTEQITLEYEVEIYGTSPGAAYFNTGIGPKQDELDINNDRISGLQADLSSGLEPQYGIFDGGDTTGLASDTRYYVTQNFFYNNATLQTKVYDSRDKTTALATDSHIYPAGLDNNYIYPVIFQTSGEDSQVYGMIGNIEAESTDIDTAYSDFSNWEEIDTQNTVNKTPNWITFNQYDTNSEEGAIYNRSNGPGTNGSTLKFEWYRHADSSSSRALIGYGDSTGGELNQIDNFIGFYYAAGTCRVRSESAQTDLVGCNNQNRLYGTITKGSSTVNVTLYSDVNRTTVVGSGEVSYNSNTDFNTTYAFVGWNQGNPGVITGQVGLGEQAEYEIPPPPFTGNISLEIANWMKHGSTQTATVINTDTGKVITSSATITSGNTTVITISGSTLTATSDVSIAEKVTITADVDGETDTANVTVANRTIENIEIMPPTQYASSFAGVDEEQSSYGIGGEIQWVLLAILIGSMASWIARNEYLGLGIIVFLLILFWAFETVSLGITLTGVFYGIFAGYMLRDTPSRSDTNVGGGLR